MTEQKMEHPSKVELAFFNNRLDDIEIVLEHLRSKIKHQENDLRREFEKDDKSTIDWATQRFDSKDKDLEKLEKETEDTLEGFKNGITEITRQIDKSFLKRDKEMADLKETVEELSKKKAKESK